MRDNKDSGSITMKGELKQQQSKPRTRNQEKKNNKLEHVQITRAVQNPATILFLSRY